MAAADPQGLFSPTVNLYSATASAEKAGELGQLYTDRKIEIGTGRAGWNRWTTGSPTGRAAAATRSAPSTRRRTRGARAGGERRPSGRGPLPPRPRRGKTPGYIPTPRRRGPRRARVDPGSGFDRLVTSARMPLGAIRSGQGRDGRSQLRTVQSGGRRAPSPYASGTRHHANPSPHLHYHKENLTMLKDLDGNPLSTHVNRRDILRIGGRPRRRAHLVHPVGWSATPRTPPARRPTPACRHRRSPGVPDAYWRYPDPYTTVTTPPGKGGTVKITFLSEPRSKGTTTTPTGRNSRRASAPAWISRFVPGAGYRRADGDHGRRRRLPRSHLPPAPCSARSLKSS